MSGREEEAPRVRIGELSRRTGVRAATIRAWEQRYGLLDPVRTPRGYRLYSAGDEQRLRSMRALTDQGLAAAEAARVARTGAAMPTGSPAPAAGLDPEAQAERLRLALEGFDDVSANAVLDESLAGLSLEWCMENVVLVAMARIGERWQSGEVSVAQEHFASSLLRGRLLGLARGWGGGGGPLAVLACPPHELHDLGLICFGLALRSRGWRIAYLGPDTPIETVAESVERLRPEAVVLSASEPKRLTDVEDALKRLAQRVHVAAGGRGASAAQSIPGITLLEDGAVSEAGALLARPRRT